jgi:hypothetical protein
VALRLATTAHVQVVALGLGSLMMGLGVLLVIATDGLYRVASRVGPSALPKQAMRIIWFILPPSQDR